LLQVSDENRLLLYALFQQVTEGSNGTSRPWGPFVSTLDQAKWDAWKHCGDMEVSRHLSRVYGRQPPRDRDGCPRVTVFEHAGYSGVLTSQSVRLDLERT
jgi:hypothetical protein